MHPKIPALSNALEHARFRDSTVRHYVLNAIKALGDELGELCYEMNPEVERTFELLEEKLEERNKLEELLAKQEEETEEEEDDTDPLAPLDDDDEDVEDDTDAD